MNSVAEFAQSIILMLSPFRSQFETLALRLNYLLLIRFVVSVGRVHAIISNHVDYFSQFSVVAQFWLMGENRLH